MLLLQAALKDRTVMHATYHAVTPVLTTNAMLILEPVLLA
jgi:hypothetical protein